MDMNSSASFYMIRSRQATRRGSQSWFFWGKKIGGRLFKHWIPCSIVPLETLSKDCPPKTFPCSHQGIYYLQGRDAQKDPKRIKFLITYLLWLWNTQHTVLTLLWSVQSGSTKFIHNVVHCQCCLFPTFLITPRTKCGSWKVPPHSLPPSPLTLGNAFIYFLHLWVQFRSVQFSRSVVSNSLRPHELQHARPPCPSPTPRVHRLTSIESVMLSSHLILWRPLLLLPPIPPSIRVFSNESILHMRWPKYCSFSFSIIPSKEIPGLISFRLD